MVARAAYFGLIALSIQTDMRTSETPISVVSRVAWASPRISATINRCLGTRLRTLQKSPFMSHTAAMAKFMILYTEARFIIPLNHESIYNIPQAAFAVTIMTNVNQMPEIYKSKINCRQFIEPPGFFTS